MGSVLSSYWQADTAERAGAGHAAGAKQRPEGGRQICG